MGLEPIRFYNHLILSQMRLPITPLELMDNISLSNYIYHKWGYFFIWVCKSKRCR